MRVGQGVYSNTQAKEKRKIPPSHSSLLYGLVWFQTKKINKNKKKKKKI